MDYKAMRDRIEDIVNDNHRDFVKAIISIEKGVNDESALNKLYELIWTMTALICCMMNLTI